MNELKPSEETLFEALSQVPMPERTARLREACGQDVELRARLEVLLAAHDRTSQFMAQSVALPVNQTTPLAIPLAERLGDQIGPYKLVQHIGEGGCGVVYMAQQEAPVRRLVALKIIKLGMDTRQVVARFEVERQALALMDHPNIAKVLDAGTTDTGRPFFVMELVRGIKITDYCDQNQLPTTERLELFIEVCHAIQHAHQKGIIHRDLKPSNILVTINDSLPVPKVIDFGIAKATQGRLTDLTLVTAFEQFLGTPAYVSPEQALLTNLDVDTRSDIYSLGVLLYELLIGRTPFDTQQLLAAGLDEMRRTIRERQPERPSTRLSMMRAADLTTVARARRAEPAKLSSQLRGDLDWIVMKCLEKDRARRYESASGLARDIERHLHNEPVVARPPSRLYEFQKTVRRHWVGFGAATAVLGVLTIGIVVSTFEAVRARRAEQVAVNVGARESSARALAEQHLYEAKLGEARAKRLSGIAGQRLESLAAIAEAAGIHRSGELRDEAIACLTLTDLRVHKTFQFRSRWAAEGAQVDSQFELYAHPDRNSIRVHRVSSNEETAFLSVQEREPGTIAFDSIQFDPKSRYLAARVVPKNGQAHWRVWDLSRGGVTVLEVVARTVAFAPDGQKVAIAYEDGTLLIHGLASGGILTRLNIGARPAKLQFSPRGTRIAGFEAGSSAVHIWDIVSGQVLVSFVSSAEISALAWSPDGSLVASGGLDGEISLWDVARGNLLDVARGLLYRWQGHRGAVSDIAFDHKGELLASAGWDGTTRLWEVAGGRALVSYATAISHLQFSLDDRLLGCAVDGPSCQLLEVVHPTGYRRLASGLIRTDALGLDVTSDWRLAAVSGNGRLVLVDLLAGKEVGVMGPRFGPWVHFDSGVASGLWSLSETGLYHWQLGFGSQAGQSFVRLQSPKCLLINEHLTGFAFDREDRKVALANRPEGTVLFWNPQDSTSCRRFCPGEEVTSLAIDPAGSWVATATWKSDRVRVWEFSTDRLIAELPVSLVANLCASPDGHWLATVNATEFRLWNARSWSRQPQIIEANPVFLAGGMSFSPDSRLLATCHDPAEIRIMEIPTLRLVARLFLPYPMQITALRFSPSGDKLAALEWSGVIHLWDLQAIQSELKMLNSNWELARFPRVKDELAANQQPLRLDIVPFSPEELAQSIPARETNAPACQVDLTKYYNAPLTVSWHGSPGEQNDLSELPRGLQTFAGVQFDVRGLIQIGALTPSGASYPAEIQGIPIGRSCHRLHFLHATINTGYRQLGTETGSYILHYTDGRQVEIPILFGQDLADWWTSSGEENMNFVIAWKGENPQARRNNTTIRLFKTTWENPYPTVPIDRFDFTSDKPSAGAPFLVALTAEP